MFVNPLAQSSTPIKFSSSKRPRRGLGLLVMVSVAFHGGLFLLPMPQWWLRSVEPEPKPEVDVEQSGAIALTILPTIAQPEPVVPEPAPTVTEQPPFTQAPLTQISDDLLEDIQEEIEGEPEDLEEEPEELEDDIEEVPALPPEDLDNNLEADLAFVFNDDFPHIEGAASGCGNYALENCRTVDGKNSSEVVTFLKQDLEAQGYKLEDVTPEDDDRYDNQKIFKMIDPNDPNAEVKYLNIFGEGLMGAFYVITSELIERQDLEALT